MSSLPLVPLGNLMASATGSVNPAGYPDEVFDLYSIPAFDLGEPEIVRGREVGSSKQVVRPNDVLLSKIVPHIRRSWVVGQDRSRRLIASGEWIVFRSDRVHPAYLRQVLVSDPFHLEFMSTVSGVGGSLLRARPAHVANLQIPLPSLPEQRRIAEVLDHAEALLAKRREAIAQVDTLTRSIFIDMFGDDCTYDSVETTVAGVADAGRGAIRTGPFGSQLLHSEFCSSGVAVLGIDNAVDNEFKWGKPRYISMTKYRALERYTVHPGDVLITIMGTCGRCAVVPDDIPLAINTKHLCCISLDCSRCLPGFLQAYFLTHPVARKYLQRVAKGAVMDGLNMGLIKDMPLRLPTVCLQQVFVDRAAAVIEHRSELRSSLAGFETLFASLQHQAFRGEL